MKGPDGRVTEDKPGMKKSPSLFGSGINIFSFAKSSSSSFLHVFCLTTLDKNPLHLFPISAASSHKFRSSAFP
jgi:hypothetical protein